MNLQTKIILHSMTKLSSLCAILWKPTVKIIYTPHNRIIHIHTKAVMIFMTHGNKTLDFEVKYLSEYLHIQLWGFLCLHQNNMSICFMHKDYVELFIFMGCVCWFSNIYDFIIYFFLTTLCRKGKTAITIIYTELYAYFLFNGYLKILPNSLMLPKEYYF